MTQFSLMSHDIYVSRHLDKGTEIRMRSINQALKKLTPKLIKEGVCLRGESGMKKDNRIHVPSLKPSVPEESVAISSQNFIMLL